MRTIPAEIIAAARAAHGRWGIPASVSLAQWEIESGWGAHEPPSSHNPFGIKAKPGAPSVTVRTREEDKGGHSYFILAAFAKFGSEAEAFDAHAKLLATATCYRAACARLPDVQRFVNLMAPHYATAHDYADALWGVIHGGNLTRFDLPAAHAA